MSGGSRAGIRHLVIFSRRPFFFRFSIFSTAVLFFAIRIYFQIRGMSGFFYFFTRLGARCPLDCSSCNESRVLYFPICFIIIIISNINCFHGISQWDFSPTARSFFVVSYFSYMIGSCRFDLHRFSSARSRLGADVCVSGPKFDVRCSYLVVVHSRRVEILKVALLFSSSRSGSSHSTLCMGCNCYPSSGQQLATLLQFCTIWPSKR